MVDLETIRRFFEIVLSGHMKSFTSNSNIISTHTHQIYMSHHIQYHQFRYSSLSLSLSVSHTHTHLLVFKTKHYNRCRSGFVGQDLERFQNDPTVNVALKKGGSEGVLEKYGEGFEGSSDEISGGVHVR